MPTQNHRETPTEAADQIIANRYVRLHELKPGAHGRSYIGTTLGDRQKVVIKTRRREGLPAGYLMRLEHEITLLSQLHCQHYNSPLELISEGDLVHVIFPFVPGSSLEKRLRSQALDVADVLRLGQGLFSALRDLHENRIIHRAVRPSSLIVNSNREIRQAILIDLGSAGSLLSASIEPERFVNEAMYYSPEQSGSIDRDISPASDLYSAGVVMFEALAGYAPFTGEDLSAVLFSHMTTTVPELRTLGLAIPRALDEVIQRLLRKDPRDRYQSAEAVLMDLAAIEQGLHEGNPEPKVVIGACDLRSTLIEPAFVSRDEELAVFDEQLESVRFGATGLILLEAESGGGKSRLLSEVSQRATTQGFRVLRGLGRNDVAQRPFHLLNGVVSRFLAECKLEEAYSDQVKRAIEQDVEVVSGSFPEIGEFYEVETNTNIGPELTGEQRTIRALANFLTALGFGRFSRTDLIGRLPMGG